MLKMLKNTIKKTSIYPVLQKIQFNRQFPDRKNTLVYIHIGKCGGVTVSEAMSSSGILQSRFKNIIKVHVTKPPILRRASYLIVVRNPISRVLSAFNWRYKLVVTDAVQKTRFSGEFEILRKYGTLNAIAEQLYSDGKLNTEVAREFRVIHHLKEDIAFYLSELLDTVSRDQVFAVLATESLNDDILNVLGVRSTEKIHENASATGSEKKYLSEMACLNLREFLVEDYRVLERLLGMSDSTCAGKEVLLK